VEVIPRLAVGEMYYNSVPSLDGRDGDTLGKSHVGAWYARHGDEIVMDLSYCMSSCGRTVWESCWSYASRVAKLTYLILMENYKGGLTDKRRKVFCLRYTQMMPFAMFSGVGADPKQVGALDWRGQPSQSWPRPHR
jgi:hypothetical protein